MPAQQIETSTMVLPRIGAAIAGAEIDPVQIDLEDLIFREAVLEP